MKALLLLITIIILQLNLQAQNLWERTNFPKKSKIISLDCSSYNGDAISDYVVYAVTNDGEFYISYNNGNSWELRNIGDNFKVTSVASNYDNYVFVGVEGHGIYKSNDFGETWYGFNQGIENDTVKVFMIKFNKNNKYIYAYSKNLGLVRSNNDNNDFKPYNTGIEDKEITCLYNDYNYIFAGTKSNGVYFRHTDSISWTPMNTNIENIEVTSLFQGFCGTKNSGIFINNNNWQIKNDSITDLNINALMGCDDIIIDIIKLDYTSNIPRYSILVGTNGGFYYQSSTSDLNFFWIKDNSGLLDSNITTLAMRYARTLFAGSETDGVYRTTTEWIYQAGVESFQQAGNIKFYPNPVSDRAIINYTLDNPEFVKISVFNAFGKKVVNIINEMQEAGKRSAPFDAGNLPNGIYFLKMQIGKKVYVDKIIVTR